MSKIKIIFSKFGTTQRDKKAKLVKHAEQVLTNGMALPDCNFNLFTNRMDESSTYKIREFVNNLLARNKINLEDNNIRLGVTCDNCKPCAITLAAITYLDVVNSHIDFSKILDLLRYQFRVIYALDHYTMHTTVKSAKGYNMDLVKYNNEIADVYHRSRMVLAELHRICSSQEIRSLNIQLVTSNNLIVDLHKGVIRIRAKANKFFDLMSSSKVSNINSKHFIMH